MSERPIMHRLQNVQEPVHVDVDPVELSGTEQRGAEKQVRRAELYYPEYGKKVDGLVFITPHYTEPTSVENYVQNAINQWRILKEINTRRNKSAEPTLTLPPTVRLYEDEQRMGILMTDLSENGANPLIDVKNLQPGLVTHAEWDEIKSQIIRDVQIAGEENILLGGGPSSLDSWACTYDLVKRTHVVYLVDIGFLTKVDAPPDMVEIRNQRILRALDTKETELFSN